MEYKISSAYLRDIYDPDKFGTIIKQLSIAVKAFRKLQPFDAIAFTGMSGAAAAYPLSMLLNIPLICVWKENSSHGYDVEGMYHVENYIIVDDFISSGDTIRRIRDTHFDTFHTTGPNPIPVISPKLVGVVYYTMLTVAATMD